MYGAAVTAPAYPLAVVHRADGTSELAASPRCEVWTDVDGSKYTEVYWVDDAERPQLGSGDSLEIRWPDGRTSWHWVDKPPELDTPGGGGYSRSDPGW